MGIYDDMAKEIDQLRMENKQLRDREAYIRELAANPHLSSSQKWAMWAVQEILGWGEKAEGLSDVEIFNVGKMIGMSRHTAGDNLIKLAEYGAIARQQYYEITEGYNGGGKQYRKRVKIGLSLFSEHPKNIKPLTKRNHGGKREKCEKCGGENLEVYEAYICKDCGHIHHAELKKETKGRHGFGYAPEADLAKTNGDLPE